MRLRPSAQSASAQRLTLASKPCDDRLMGAISGARGQSQRQPGIDTISQSSYTALDVDRHWKDE